MRDASAADALRSQRKNVSVLKVNLARMRERSPYSLVIVMEGKDDLPVYEAWLKRIQDGLKWEPMIAQGKGKVLEFRDLIRRDKTGIGACTYFIVDHDYDGLRSSVEDDDIYVLPAYSVENYLTAAEVFDSFLRTDLHVVGDPVDRAPLVERFVDLEHSFVAAILPACIKLYGARNERVGNVTIDERVGGFIDIDVEKVQVRSGADVGDMVRSDLPISAGGYADGADFLNRPNVRLWIRGKFLIYFYKKICGLFYKDRCSVTPILFSEQAHGLRYAPASVDFRSLAAKSPLPVGLKEMVCMWSAACNSKKGVRDNA